MHRRDVKKIPITDKTCQMYEEEQINKTRNGRKLVPDNKMPNLSWNLEKQEIPHKENIQEIEAMCNQNRALQMFIHITIFIYSYILLIQDIVAQARKSSSKGSKTSIKNNREL